MLLLRNSLRQFPPRGPERECCWAHPAPDQRELDEELDGLEEEELLELDEEEELLELEEEELLELEEEGPPPPGQF